MVEEIEKIICEVGASPEVLVLLRETENLRRKKENKRRKVWLVDKIYEEFHQTGGTVSEGAVEDFFKVVIEKLNNSLPLMSTPEQREAIVEILKLF